MDFKEGATFHLWSYAHFKFPVTKVWNDSQSKGKKGKFAPVLNEALRHENLWGSGDIGSRLLGLGTRWR
jgi:hypothetical protein